MKLKLTFYTGGDDKEKASCPSLYTAIFVVAVS